MAATCFIRVRERLRGESRRAEQAAATDSHVIAQRDLGRHVEGSSIAAPSRRLHFGEEKNAARADVLGEAPGLDPGWKRHEGKLEEGNGKRCPARRSTRTGEGFMVANFLPVASPGGSVRGKRTVPHVRRLEQLLSQSWAADGPPGAELPRAPRYCDSWVGPETSKKRTWLDRKLPSQKIASPTTAAEIGFRLAGFRWQAAGRALRHRNFQLFFSGQLISLIGTWMQTVAQSWLVYRLTGSGLLLGCGGVRQPDPCISGCPDGRNHCRPQQPATGCDCDPDRFHAACIRAGGAHALRQNPGVACVRAGRAAGSGQRFRYSAGNRSWSIWWARKT